MPSYVERLGGMVIVGVGILGGRLNCSTRHRIWDVAKAPNMKPEKSSQIGILVVSVGVGDEWVNVRLSLRSRV